MTWRKRSWTATPSYSHKRHQHAQRADEEAHEADDRNDGADDDQEFHAAPLARAGRRRKGEGDLMGPARATSKRLQPSDEDMMDDDAAEVFSLDAVGCSGRNLDESVLQKCLVSCLSEENNS